MDLITISREYGAGGSEVARQLAPALGWELLDRALLHQAAQIECAPDLDVDGSTPLMYDLTGNRGRRGPLALDVVAWAAEQHGQRIG